MYKRYYFLVQVKEHVVDGKQIEAKAAVARNADGTNSTTKKMFVGGTVSPHLQRLAQQA